MAFNQQKNSAITALCTEAGRFLITKNVPIYDGHAKNSPQKAEECMTVCVSTTNFHINAFPCLNV